MKIEDLEPVVSLKEYIEKLVSGLKEYFDKLRQADKEAIDIALKAADRANDKSEAAQTRVNETQNEFRGSLKDQAATLMPRAEFESTINRINTDITSLRESRATMEGKASSTSVYISYLIALVGIILGIMGLLRK